jgi:hypothetical protein
MKCINEKCFNSNIGCADGTGCSKFGKAGVVDCHVSEIEKPKLRPFTWDERNLLVDNWIKSNRTGNEYLPIAFSNTHRFMIHLGEEKYSAAELLESFKFSYDGSPCGVEE